MQIGFVRIAVEDAHESRLRRRVCCPDVSVQRAQSIWRVSHDYCDAAGPAQLIDVRPSGWTQYPAVVVQPTVGRTRIDSTDDK